MSKFRTPRFGFVLEYVPDVVAARSFYTDVLGLKVSRESPEFIQFADGEGAGWAIASDASLSGETKPETYWVVDDAAAQQKILSVKVTITLPLEERPFGQGFGVADPAGKRNTRWSSPENGPARK